MKKENIIKAIIAILIGLFLISITSIDVNAESQTITGEGVASCSVYCYVAEEDEVIVIPKVFIDEKLNKNGLKRGATYSILSNYYLIQN